MQKMQYCTCRINLAGQNYHIVDIDEFNPVTWPEMQVLMALHGDENVMDIMPVGDRRGVADRREEPPDRASTALKSSKPASQGAIPHGDS